MDRSIACAGRLAAFALCLAGGAVQAQPQPPGSTLAPSLVVTVLEKHLALIEHREAVVARRYGPDGAGLTVIAAFRKAGISERTIEGYAHAWSAAGLTSDYLWARSFYSSHQAALRESIANVRNRASVSRDELLRIDRGMEIWKANEEELHALFAERVRLHTQSARATDLDFAAESMACGEDAGCRLARSAKKAAAQEASNAAGESLGGNRWGIQWVASVRVFDPIAAGPPLPACTELTLGYEPGRLTHGQTARPKVALGPADCRPRERPAFRLKEAGAPFWLDQATGTLHKTDNAAGTATVEAVVTTPRGDLVATAQVIGAAAPPCTALDWTHVDRRMHLREFGSMQLDFQPKGCFPHGAPVTIATDRPNVLWIEDGTATARNLYGLAEGTAQITASSGTLQAPKLSIEVLNDGPPCTSMQLSYFRTRLRVGTRTETTPGGRGHRLAYLPQNCRQPAGAARYSLVNPRDAESVALDAATGAVQGLKAGTAKVIAGHGDLPGNAVEFTVVDRPTCDALVVTLSRNPLRVGEEAQAEYRAVNAAGGLSADEPDAHMCTAPQARLSYASDNADAAPVDDRGIVKGVAAGSAIIELTLGGLKGRTEATVRP
jgi:hypothetical protein